MGTTTNYTWPYPANSDGPFGPSQMQALATAADATVKGIDNRTAALEAVPKWYHVTRSTDQTISNNTVTDASWTVETSDRNSLAAVTWTTFTVPAGMGGVWIAMQFARFATNGTGIRVMALSAAGTQITEDRRDAMSGAAQPHAMYCGFIKLLAAGDAVKGTYFQNSGSSLAIESGAGNTPQLMLGRLML